MIKTSNICQINEIFTPSKILEFGDTDCKADDGYEWSELSQTDDMEASCPNGAVGKWGTLGGEHETKFIVSGFESLSSKFTCNQEDQVRGFECGVKSVKYCCKKGL